MKIREGFADFACCGNRNVQSLSIDPTDFADTLFGVGSATSTGPMLKAGSIHPSPETLKNDCGGYMREQPVRTGICFGRGWQKILR